MIEITSDEELEEAMREYEALQEARPGTADAERAHELQVAIKAYEERHKGELRPGRP